MNRGQIRTALENEIQDPSYTSEQLNDFIHQAVLRTAGAVKLPDLKRLGSVTTTGNAYATLSGLSGGFSGRLSRVLNYDLDIYPSLEAMADKYASITGNENMNQSGVLEAAALEGSTFWYQYIPATPTVIPIIYYQNPPVLANDSAVPTYIPEELHYQMFVNGAAFLIYSQIEDGEGDTKVNMNYHFGMSFSWDNKHSGINELRAWVVRNSIPMGDGTWSA